MSYMTLSSQEKTTISEKNSLATPLFYSVRAFACIRQHYFSKYWGDVCIGRPLTSNFFGTVPLGIRPCLHVILYTIPECFAVNLYGRCLSRPTYIPPTVNCY